VYVLVYMYHDEKSHERMCTQSEGRRLVSYIIRLYGVVGSIESRRLRQRKAENNCNGGDSGGERQGDSKWSMPGFSADPGGAVLVVVRYIVKAVQS
jgi:hypothetical protein